MLTTQLAQSNARILARMLAGDYDFVDLGTRHGGGFVIGEKLGGRRGVGFDLDAGTAQWNIDQGRDVVCQDVRAIPPGAAGIRFAVCNHVLEHLPSIYDVGSVIAALAAMCSDYLLISGPNFDTEEYLYSHGLKVLHSAMRDHLCKFRTIDLIRILFDLGLRDFVLGLTGEMADSSSVWIHRGDAPAEGLWMWEAGKSLPKPFITFNPPLHRDFVCVIKLRAEVMFTDILGSLLSPRDRVMLRSAQRFPE